MQSDILQRSGVGASNALSGGHLTMTVDRRRILQIALGGGSLSPLVLPERWVKPVVKSVDRSRPCRGLSGHDHHAGSDDHPRGSLSTFGSSVTSSMSGIWRTVSGYIAIATSGATKSTSASWRKRLQRLLPDAVVYGDDGYLRVDYARLGLRLITWEEWVAGAGPCRDLFSGRDNHHNHHA